MYFKIKRRFNYFFPILDRRDSFGKLQVINVQKYTNQEKNECITQLIRSSNVCTFLRKKMLKNTDTLNYNGNIFLSHFVLMLEENLKWGR